MKPANLPRVRQLIVASAITLACIRFSVAQPSGEVSADTLIGTPLPQFIEQLRAEGLNVIYSSELVSDSLLIENEPDGRTPRRRLRSVLRPLNLKLQQGPQSSWLIVSRDPRRPAPEPAAAVTAQPAISPPPLENVIVTASRYAFARDPFASGDLLDRQQIEATASIGDDAMRPIANLPGISGNGLSGQMNIRGGAADETQTMFDGIELTGPFHLKDFQSVFGSISPRIVDHMDVRTGGFAPRYGNRMSGVVDIQPVAPTAQRSVEVGVSTINTSVLSGGRFNDDRSSWLASLRRGNIDVLIDAADSDFGTPQFTDFFARATHELSPSIRLRAGVLTLNDKLSLRDNFSDASADYDDAYFWVGAEQDIHSRLSASYVLSLTKLDAWRTGQTALPNVAFGELADRRSFDAASVRAHWTLRQHSRHLLEWGLVAVRSNASLQFASQLQHPVPIVSAYSGPGPGTFNALASYSDTSISPYFDYRLSVGDKFTLQLGLRADDRSSVDERSTSPRIGALWDVSPSISLRASWGRYRQMQALNEVQISDKDPVLHSSQIAEHSILSLELNPNDRLAVRLEAFEKQIENPRLRFENLFNRLSLVPELLPDRVRIAPDAAKVSGFETSIDMNLSQWRWWFNYSRLQAKDYLAQGAVRRGWENTWSAKAGVIRETGRWTISSTLAVRSGWPISTPRFDSGQIVVSALNDTTIERFRSLDVKAVREFRLSRGSIELTLELVNALNDENACCFEHTPLTNGSGSLVGLELESQNWLPGVPIIGFRWSRGQF